MSGPLDELRTELRQRPPRGISGNRGVQADLAQHELLALLDRLDQLEAVKDAAQELRRAQDDDSYDSHPEARAELAWHRGEAHP